MIIINQQIKPIGFCTIEFNEAEIQSLVDTIEQIQAILRQPDVMGIRGEIYQNLKAIMNITKPN